MLGTEKVITIDAAIEITWQLLQELGKQLVNESVSVSSPYEPSPMLSTVENMRISHARSHPLERLRGPYRCLKCSACYSCPR
jgi:hypothetical protein